VSAPGLECLKPDARQFFYRIRVHRGRKGERRSLSEADYAGLVTAAHHQLRAPLILIWDYVPRNIIPVLCPVVLCGQRRLAVLVTGGERLGGAAAGHIMFTARQAR
jgi:putative transposase